MQKITYFVCKKIFIEAYSSIILSAILTKQ